MRAIVIRGIIVALLVGTILTFINQFERVVALETLNWWKTGLSYLVPFCVSVFSALAVTPE
ncbi:nitrate/nitrite transporter NrtS [Hyphomonas sp.]|uniref:nitrate/nitrite transporter NrtS n=1 Tax=Hyphomonas sp. TaxID=87 RepID=UPI0032EE8134|tara:strand:- start:201 stop:383 length:183 start_codon:yes stop_codon:yes gene_type:complete